MTEMFSMSMLMITNMYGIINKFKMREEEVGGVATIIGYYAGLGQYEHASS